MERTAADRAVAIADAANRRIGRAHLDLLVSLIDIDRLEVWRDDGARDLAHWVSMRYGVSMWKAYRWIAAALALPHLPRIAEALATGVLPIDKVVELTRFATPDTEASLIRWARDVSSGAVRHRANVLAQRDRDDIEEPHRSRRLEWWFTDDERRFELEGELPASEGAVVAKALERLALTIPAMPGEEDVHFAPARRADALVAMCAAGIASDADPDRATVVVHAQLGSRDGAEIEGLTAIDVATARRLMCTSRTQVVVEDGEDVVHVSELSRAAPAWMLRQVRYRDRGCRFPGCGTNRFTEAHHIVWWRNAGRTSLDNLVLICSFHHRLVHEYGWTIERASDGAVAWRRPDGTRHVGGPPARAPDVAA